MRTRLLLSTFSLFCLLCSCKKLFTYNKNEIQLDEKNRHQNIKNIELLRSKSQNTPFRFVVISDTQRFYDELDEFVKKINRYPGISFVVVNGDITDFGLRSEYLWISER